MKALYVFVFPILLPFLLNCQPDSRSREPDLSRVDLPQKIAELGVDTKDIWIHISKSGYTLTLKADTISLKTYPVVFGDNPVDDKLMQGDYCTPEGWFTIKEKYPHKDWQKFMWIDYPTKESWAKHNAAKAAGKIPADASIGGEIGIHGITAGSEAAVETKVNWTLGCISLRNADVNEVYRYTEQGAKVFIEK